MSALAEADQKIGDYFGETDGRIFLTAFAEKKDTMFKFPPDDVPLFEAKPEA